MLIKISTDRLNNSSTRIICKSVFIIFFIDIKVKYEKLGKFIVYKTSIIKKINTSIFTLILIW